MKGVWAGDKWRGLGVLPAAEGLTGGLGSVRVRQMAWGLQAPGLSCSQTSVLPTFLPRTHTLACRTGSNGRAGLGETKAGMEGGLWD